MEELPASVITDCKNCISIFKNRLDRGSELSLAIVANIMQVVDWSTRQQRICEYHIWRNYFVQILRQNVWHVDQSATSLIESWFVSELSGYQYNRWVTGQLANKPTRGQSSHGLVNLRTGQLAEMFDLKFGVNNSSKCHSGQIIPARICC